MAGFNAPTDSLSLMVPEWPARQEKAASAIDLLTALSGPGNDILTSACENSGNEKPNADRTKTAPSQRSDFHEVIKPEAESRSSAVNQPSLQQSDPSRGDEPDRHLDPQALNDSPTDRLPQAASSAGHAGQHHQHGNPACPRQATL